MKKALLKISFTVILSIAIAGIFAGCDGKSKTATAGSILGGHGYSLPIKLPDGALPDGSGSSFYLDISLEDMKSKVTTNDVSAEIFAPDFLLITTKSLHGYTQYFLVERIRGNYFYLSCPSVFRSNLGGNEYSILVPFHLISGNTSSHYDRAITENRNYKLTTDREKFVAFYSAVGIYDIKTHDDSIDIFVREDAIFGPINPGNGTLFYHTRMPFSVTFEEIDGEIFVSYCAINGY